MAESDFLIKGKQKWYRLSDIHILSIKDNPTYSYISQSIPTMRWGTYLGGLNKPWQLLSISCITHGQSQVVVANIIVDDKRINDLLLLTKSLVVITVT